MKNGWNTLQVRLCPKCYKEIFYTRRDYKTVRISSKEKHTILVCNHCGHEILFATSTKIIKNPNNRKY